MDNADANTTLMEKISRNIGGVLSQQTVALALLLGAAAFSLYYLVVAVDQPLLESFGFRKTQTALSAYYFVKNGVRIDYWTPVIGQGWSIPFEFPIYQAIVAFVVKLIGTPLAATGRVVSWLFMVACCWPLYMTLRQIRAKMATRYLCLALFVGAPEYVFWSSTFMIETAALFFTLFFIYYGARILMMEARAWDFALGCLFLTLAILQKSTTGLPIAILFSVLVAVIYLRPSTIRSNWQAFAAATVMVLIAVCIGSAWAFYADLVKIQNPIGTHLTASSLNKWNFGTFGQHISWKLWHDVLFDRVFGISAFGGIGLTILGVGLAIAPDGRQRKIILLALCAWILPFLIFTNLNIVHDYYQSSSTVFLLLAIGLAVAVIFEQLLATRQVLQNVAITWLVVANFVSFMTNDAPLRSAKITASNNLTLKISDFVRAHTTEDDTVVWYGFDWSSEAAFYSERKSLTVPPWDDFEEDTIANWNKYLDHEPKAFVVCGSKNKEKILAALRAKYQRFPEQEIDACHVFLRYPALTPR